MNEVTPKHAVYSGKMVGESNAGINGNNDFTEGAMYFTEKNKQDFKSKVQKEWHKKKPLHCTKK